jgi:hypothetical protein
MIKLNIEKTEIRNLLQGVFISSCFFILVLSSFSQAKKNQPAKPSSQVEKADQTQIEIVKWRNVSEEITKDIVSDTKNSSYSERPIILARLVNLWWRNDNDTAREWLKTAVSEVTFDKLVETDAEKTKRFEVARKLIKFITPMDKQLTDKLNEYISKHSNSTDLNQQNADELIKNALEIVDTNPILARNLGSLSLKKAQSYQIFRLIRELNLKDEKLSISLFNEALVSAEKFPNLETSVGFVSSLSNVALRGYKNKSLPESARKNYLAVLFNLISTESILPSSQKQSCMFVLVAANFINSYETYFPEKALSIRLKSTLCGQNQKDFASLVGSDLDETKPQTAEEYIQAAKETKDNFLKGTYYSRAVQKLYEAKEYEKIISVLDDMTEEEKKAFGEDTWNGWRSDSALRAAVEFVKTKNFSDAYRIINNTPKMLRPAVQSGLAKEMEKEDKPFAITLLNDARKGLNSYDIEPKKKASLLLFITKQYAEIVPYETADVFKEAVKAVNNSDDTNPENNPVKDYAPLKETILLPIFLLETEEPATLGTLSNIKSVNSRIRFRLGFLEQSLKKLDEANAKNEKKLEAK